MSIITQAIANADREARYLSRGELDAIQHFFAEGNQRLRIAAVLTSNADSIIESGSQRFWQRCPVTPSNSGNSNFRSSCLRDQGWFLRLISYAVVVGDIDPLQASGVRGVREMYLSLEIPLKNVAECIRCIKEAALELLVTEDAAEVAPYFDYLIQGLMP
ncbi:allophycocyanin subunit alpha-B [Oscillatoria sp. CS-180]|uniref:allophycocyanin subunit alpha-B n=1 Tax=Oscillatoria sp. CS-180 TaxID=3021720 RepID=UPI00232DE1A1|nr:allophycocyanin subunit alpha-B [Oscillatoria sp. CS-180]MDB9526397.1 allophycocyanin subunit alpha-B [Oscillatoria sp. CS-180]